MSLVKPYPDQIPPDPSHRRTLVFNSPADEQTQRADVYSPASSDDEPLPLVLSPHAAGWTAEENYHGGMAGLKIGYHRGWYGLSEKYRVLIVIPHGHHRREPLLSLASPEQTADLIYLIDLLEDNGYRVDRRRVYACGISMGGQEALVAAGRHPGHLAAVVAFNPVVDLAAWQEDMARSTVDEIRQKGSARFIASEVGGLPAEIPEAYAERSPVSYVDGLAQVPTMLYWTDKDLIVPRQVTHHSYRLYQMIKERSVTNPVAEYNHTFSHRLTDFSEEECWQLHEWCDYELALRWLLIHEKQ
jgi:pimeloyl-ACP methyl ester carboxylesterase